MSPEALFARRLVLESSPGLRALADRLNRLAAPLLEKSPYIPEQKALLSRDGGVCPEDGTRLTFDPWSPLRHRCPRCGRVHEGERHHRAWVWRYHIWLSERAVHLALLGVLTSEPRRVNRAYEIVEQYALRYRTYPNNDNVLGPTRLFFSTYLESIWLMQLVCAALVVRAAESEGLAVARDWSSFDAVVEESAALIATFDEAWSNRQVWNNGALIAAGLWLSGCPSGQTFLSLGLHGPHGVLAQLTSCVSDCGLWYEGENYHFFALRGFLLAAELLRISGFDLYGNDAPVGRLCDMYAAPLATALPDLTLPARGDAPFGVSLLQPRFAELWEVGWSRTGDPRLESILSHLYSVEAPEGEEHGAAEMAEQEQNRPPSRSSRTRLGWKALWCMNPQPPAASPDLWQTGSTLLTEAGIAVMRPATNHYVSVECGGRPGGHGHPDLLHLTLYWGGPQAVDMGTGSYVSSSLHWYRSTLAHNAPGISGIGQTGRTAWCAAFDERDGWAWCRSVADAVLGEGSRATRTVVVAPSYVLDRLEVVAAQDAVVDFPLHVLATPLAGLADCGLAVGSVLQHDGALGSTIPLDQPTASARVAAHLGVLLEQREGEQLFLAEGPGPPDIWFTDGAPSAFLVRRARGTGTWIQCWLFGGDAPVRLTSSGRDVRLEYSDGSSDTIVLRSDRCQVTDRRGTRVRLKGGLPEPCALPRRPAQHRRTICPLITAIPSAADWDSHLPSAAIHELVSESYRRSEWVHGEGDAFHARAAVFVSGDRVCFAVDVTKRDIYFRRVDEPDPALDNEVPDIHSDGLQCYFGRSGGWSGYLVVPDPDSQGVRASAVGGEPAPVGCSSGEWVRTEGGYRMVVWFSTGHRFTEGEELLVNLIVNEMYPGRQRRAGQLALSGGGGWVYLRGDREHPSYALLAEVT